MDIAFHDRFGGQLQVATGVNVTFYIAVNYHVGYPDLAFDNTTINDLKTVKGIIKEPSGVKKRNETTNGIAQDTTPSNEIHNIDDGLYVIFSS